MSSPSQCQSAIVKFTLLLGFVAACDSAPSSPGGSAGAWSAPVTAGTAPVMIPAGGAGAPGVTQPPLPPLGNTAAGSGGRATLPVPMAGSLAAGAGAAGSLAGASAGGAGAGVAGAAGAAGASGSVAAVGGSGGAAGAAGGPTPMTDGKCCDDGDCLCHGPDPSQLTSAAGPYKTAMLTLTTGTAYYPTDAEPPFAAVALCGGFLNSGPEMAEWGPLYASHGIVTVIVSTLGSDFPDIRAMKLLAAVAELKAKNTESGGPLSGKLAGRYGTSGYSMGGGGTTLAATQESSLKTSIGLAPWGGVGNGVTVPTLLLCGSSDSTAPCNMAQGAYSSMPEATPKMLISISGATHFNWFGPNDAGRGLSGQYALAFQKVYLEGDTRWKPLLLTRPSGGMQTTNIK